MTHITPSEALARCVEHREIFHDEMLQLMRALMRGEMSAQMATALIMGLRGSNTFNISTAAMFVAAASGAKVAKHGGRSASSSSGSVDVVEALGVNIELTPAQIAECIAETGIGFMFAPAHHGAMKYVAPIRKELGIKTIFNILGPLTNPAGAGNQLMGVFHGDLVGIQVRVLERLGSKHVLIVHGKDGMDEVSLGAPTLIGELKDGEIKEYEIHPEDFNVTMSSNRSRDESAALVREALDNVEGPARDIVALNAGLAIYAANRTQTMKEGVKLAFELIANGAAREKLETFSAYTRKFKS